MNKLWVVPIATFLILSLGLIGGLTGFTNTETNDQMIINSAGFNERNMGFGTSYLNLNINATFLEDIESITINGVLHKKDGSYSNVNFYGNPNNGLKNQEYLLDYTSSFMMDSEDIKNMDYLEVTVKTINKEGKGKDIKLNITSNGQVTTNQDVAGLSLQNRSKDLNSNNTKNDEKNNSESNNYGSKSKSSSYGSMTASQAKKIAQNSIKEPGASVGAPHWDSSIEMWVMKIYKDGKVIDAIGVESNGHTNRLQ